MVHGECFYTIYGTHTQVLAWRILSCAGLRWPALACEFLRFQAIPPSSGRYTISEILVHRHRVPDRPFLSAPGLFRRLLAFTRRPVWRRRRPPETAYTGPRSGNLVRKIAAHPPVRRS